MNNVIEKNRFIIFFLLSVLFRVIHFIFSDYGTFFCCDVSRYLDTSQNIINGNYNLINDLFITAPLYSYYLAFLRIVDEVNFLNLMIVTQILVSSIGTIFIIKISEKIFNNKTISIISGFVYSIYPTTFFYTHMVAQETLFGFLFIISSYYYCKFVNRNKTKYLAIFAIFASLTVLTKSHVTIIFVLLIISITVISKEIKKKIYNSFFVISIIALVTFPNGYYNYIKNGLYVLSSSGSGMFMSAYHNDKIFNFLVEINSLDEIKEQDTIHLYPVSNINLTNMTIKEKENYWINEALDWIKNNPKKFIKMKIYNFFHFFAPGLNINHYSFKKWLISFLISMPIYIGAYISIYRCVKVKLQKHLLIISTLVGMAAFSIIFMPIDRFIFVTLEPFLIIYFADFIKNSSSKLN
jgi:hypothetical protein